MIMRYLFVCLYVRTYYVGTYIVTYIVTYTPTLPIPRPLFPHEPQTSTEAKEHAVLGIYLTSYNLPT